MSPFRQYQFNARGKAHSRRHRWRRLLRKFGWRRDGIYIARSLWGKKV